MDESANMFPIGIGFKPMEGYLLPWEKGQKIQWEGVVEKQMYGENFPWKVFRDIETEVKGAIKYTIYAFTTLLRASTSKRVSRRAENGTWGGQTGPKKIENRLSHRPIDDARVSALRRGGRRRALDDARVLPQR
ncbi:hypothetical protein SASPL_123284 [Salvia splendens]|uniref:Uncharacterized protein n=1 Tax=Salvia splendens TaxID=180675 RepID=A0A8X8XPJ3_SALSN|nr:hypothetical protein SASPL_123284 [Salvia splendens]